MSQNVLNVPESIVWDVFDAKTARRLIHNATLYDVDTLLADHKDPVTLEPVGHVVSAAQKRAAKAEAEATDNVVRGDE